MNSLKKFILYLFASSSLFLISIYLPLFFFVYFPAWHLNQLQENKRIPIIGEKKAKEAVSELYRFFRHENDLTLTEWSEKEKRHLREVRGIFDLLALLFFLSLLFLIGAKKRIPLEKICLWNGLVLLVLGIVLSVHFVFFWKNIFHPLLFKNDLWKNTPLDLSYYLMPRSFFKKISIMICCFSLIFQFLACLLLKGRRHAHTKSIR